MLDSSPRFICAMPVRSYMSPTASFKTFGVTVFSCTNWNTVATSVPASASVIESEDGSMGFCEASATPCFTMVDEQRGSLHVQLASPFFCFELPLVAG